MNLRKTLVSISVLMTVAVSSCATPETIVPQSASPSASPSRPRASAAQPVTYAAALDEAVVQVWISDAELAATGVVVGDGTQILTVLNYETSTPENADIVTTSGDRYRASVGAIESRTAATVLHLEGAGLPVAETGDSSVISPGGAVTALEWRRPYAKDGPGTPELVKTALVAEPDPERRPVSFGVHFPNGVMPSGGVPPIGQGAIIADSQGRVIGLVGTDYNTLFPHPHAFGAIPGVAAIHIAIELLLPGAANGPYSNGPLLVIIRNPDGSGAMRGGQFPNYEAVSNALRGILSRTDGQVPQEDMPQDYRRMISGTVDEPADGTVVTVPYPRPVELKNPDGKLVGTGRWVGIQFGRSGGKPDRLFFGDGVLVVKGGFYIKGDISEFTRLVAPAGDAVGGTAALAPCLTP
jgi:hypothetical protein